MIYIFSLDRYRHHLLITPDKKYIGKDWKAGLNASKYNGSYFQYDWVLVVLK